MEDWTLRDMYHACKDPNGKLKPMWVRNTNRKYIIYGIPCGELIIGNVVPTSKLKEK
jgi:hypothetical protein